MFNHVSFMLCAFFHTYKLLAFFLHVIHGMCYKINTIIKNTFVHAAIKKISANGREFFITAKSQFAKLVEKIPVGQYYR